jgi:hypothetical protein
MRQSRLDRDVERRDAEGRGEEGANALARTTSQRIVDRPAGSIRWPDSLARFAGPIRWPAFAGGGCYSIGTVSCVVDLVGGPPGSCDMVRVRDESSSLPILVSVVERLQVPPS